MTILHKNTFQLPVLFQEPLRNSRFKKTALNSYSQDARSRGIRLQD